MTNQDRGAAEGPEASLDGAIVEYIVEDEAGRTPDRSAFLARHPDVAGDLARFLDDRERIGRLLGPTADEVADAAGPPRMTCPHCHGPLASTETRTACPGCGAKFRLDGDAAGPPGRRRLGRFELLAIAGRGAFGTVYKARDSALDRDVAVKVSRKGMLTTPAELDRFFREARFAGSLHHPGIARVYETGYADGLPYLVSEFVQGPTLATLLAEGRPDPDRAAELLASVAEALHYAHEHGVIHRDVKPSNILLRAGRVPVVVDFGLALRDGGEPTLTLDGESLGTPAYMSPEQARGDSHRVDRRSDVYGLGVVLYELLTGQRPFVGNPRMVLNQILRDDPRPPRRLNDRLPRDLETACLKCLSKEPARRYATAADLADDLRRYRAREPIRARPPGLGGRLARWARRNPGLAAASGLAATLLVATTSVSVAWGVHAGRQARAIRGALDESERRRAEGQLDRGLSEANQGNVGAGLLWMARSVETAPPGESGPGRVARMNLDAWRRELFAIADCSPAPPGEVLGFSPDGRGAWVVDAGGRSVGRWDLEAVRRVGPSLEHPERVTALAVSADGARVATGSEGRDRPFRVWDAATGGLIRTLEAAGPACGVAFYPDGRSLLTASLDKKPGSVGTVFRAWDVATGRPAAPEFRQPGWVGRLALDPEARILYTVIQPGKLIRRWEMEGGRFRDADLAQPVPVKALAVSPDGRHLLIAGGDRQVRLCEASAGRPVATLPHGTPASAVAFLPGGRGLIAASPGDAVRSWEGTEWLAPPVPPLAGGVRAVAISPDGKRVATGSDDWTVRLWVLASGVLVPDGALPVRESPIASVDFSPDGRLLAVSTHQHQGATLWDPATRRPRATLRHPDRVAKVAFSRDGSRVATVGRNGAVWLWDADGSRAIALPLGPDRSALAAAFSPDGRTLATGGREGLVGRWDASTGSPLGPPLVHAPGTPVGVVLFSPGGEALLTAGEDGVARLWDAAGSPLGPPLGHGYRVGTASFSPDGRSVLTGGWDNAARLWRADTGLGAGPPLQHAGRIRAALVGPSGEWAVTASEDGTARFWDLGSGRALGPPLRHEGEVRCAVVEPGGGWVVTAGLDRTARAWRAPAPIDGPAPLLALWAEVLAGAELDRSGGMQALDPPAWADRRRRLERLGGPSSPREASPRRR